MYATCMQSIKSIIKAFLSIKQTKTNRKKERQTSETKRLFVTSLTVFLNPHYKQNVLAI